MDYKKIIKSRAVRINIMKALSFVPDKTMLEIQYWIKMGRKLNLKNPQRYTEKLQWYKLYYRDPLMAQCVDKYEVRKYVESCGLGDTLNECIGVYNSPDEIDFDTLPNQFVLKDTLGGGGNGVIICKDKSTLDIPRVIDTMRDWVKPASGKHPGREWVYDCGKNRIVAERYIPSDPEKGGLIDYKFFYFNGKLAYVYGIADRKLGQRSGFGIFSPDFELLPYTRLDEKPLERTLEKPANYEQLKAVAAKLAAPFPHARIDLYDQDGKILFGEITFFDGSGYMKFDPDEFDFMMGSKFELPEKGVCNV